MAEAERDYDALLRSGAANAQIGLVRLALEHGADPNRVRSRGSGTALHAVAVVGDGRGGDVVDALVAAGADVEARANEYSMDGATPLFLAAADGNRNVVAALARHGADVNAPLDNGFTPLMAAIEDHRRAVVHFLIEAGA